MTIKVGDRLPAGTLWEFIEEETPGCSVGPNSFELADARCIERGTPPAGVEILVGQPVRRDDAPHRFKSAGLNVRPIT